MKWALLMAGIGLAACLPAQPGPHMEPFESIEWQVITSHTAFIGNVTDFKRIKEGDHEHEIRISVEATLKGDERSEVVLNVVSHIPVSEMGGFLIEPFAAEWKEKRSRLLVLIRDKGPWRVRFIDLDDKGLIVPKADFTFLRTAEDLLHHVRAVIKRYSGSPEVTLDRVSAPEDIRDSWSAALGRPWIREMFVPAFIPRWAGSRGPAEYNRRSVEK